MVGWFGFWNAVVKLEELEVIIELILKPGAGDLGEALLAEPSTEVLRVKAVASEMQDGDKLEEMNVIDWVESVTVG